MSTLFSIKKGARLPSVEMTLTSASAYDLATATSVNFVYRTKGVAERTVVALVVVDAPTKLVRLDLSAAEVDTIGKFQCHVEVTIDGKVMTFPHKGFDEFEVTETIEVV